MDSGVTRDPVFEFPVSDTHASDPVPPSDVPVQFPSAEKHPVVWLHPSVHHEMYFPSESHSFCKKCNTIGNFWCTACPITGKWQLPD